MVAKKFNNPKKLGLIRFWQVYFSLIMVFNILALVLFVKSDYQFDVNDIIDFAEVILYGVICWLIYQRKKATRVVVIAVSLFAILASFVAEAVQSGRLDIVYFSDEHMQLNISFGLRLLCAAYFFFSKQVKAQLTKSFSANVTSRQLAEREHLYQPQKWFFWRNTIVYFCVFSVVGHWLEALYCTLIRFGIIPGVYDPNSPIWRDWLWPYPVYGFGAVACIILLFPIKNFILKKTKNTLLTLALSFIANVLVCTAIELIMGLIFNRPDASGKFPLWDYTNMPFNFMGQICLQNAVAFGVVATLMVWLLYPLFERLLRRLSHDIMQVIFVSVVVFFSILMSLYCIKLVIFV
jgi:uncharacterized membrane protein